jgi:hypothetical protein
MADEDEKTSRAADPRAEPRQLPREQQPIDITPSEPAPAEPAAPIVPPASSDEPRS